MNQPKNRSLQAKSASRMAAVQLAYRAKMRGDIIVPETLISEYKTFREDDPAIKGEAPSNALLSQLLNGIAEHDAVLENVAQEQLKINWKAERTNPILIAILKLAIFELDHNRNLKDAVIIDEYTTISAKLLEHDEVGYVHATLKNLAIKIRG